MTIPDRQTQIAQFLTGNIDVIRNATADTAREIGTMPDARVTPTHAGLMMYVTLDALGRSDNKVMKDQRVRKAFIEAIDRKALANSVIPGGETADMLDGICVPANVGCASSTSPPATTPRTRRSSSPRPAIPTASISNSTCTSRSRRSARPSPACCGKLGIRASVRPLPIALYVRMRGEGKFTAFLGFYPTGAQPDMDNIFDIFFNDTRDYWNDPVIQAAQKAGAIENDEAKRREIYKAGIDQVNKMNYIFPVADLPLVFVHSKDVRILDDSLARSTPAPTISPGRNRMCASKGAVIGCNPFLLAFSWRLRFCARVAGACPGPNNDWHGCFHRRRIDFCRPGARLFRGERARCEDVHFAAVHDFRRPPPPATSISVRPVSTRRSVSLPMRARSGSSARAAKSIPAFTRSLRGLEQSLWRGAARFRHLGGHSVATAQFGGAFQYDIGLALKKYGIAEKTVRILGLQTNGNIASAIGGGQVDAAVQS